MKSDCADQTHKRTYSLSFVMGLTSYRQWEMAVVHIIAYRLITALIFLIFGKLPHFGGTLPTTEFSELLQLFGGCSVNIHLRQFDHPFWPFFTDHPIADSISLYTNRVNLTLLLKNGAGDKIQFSFEDNSKRFFHCLIFVSDQVIIRRRDVGLQKPNYFWYLFFSDVDTTDIYFYYENYYNLNQLTYPAIFLEIRGLAKVYFICMHCLPWSKRQMQVPHLSSVHDVVKSWSVLHSNFLGEYVYTLFQRKRVRELYGNCYFRLFPGMMVDNNACIILKISEHLNFSLDEDSDPHFDTPVGDVVRVVIEENVVKNSQRGGGWLPHGVFIRPIKFLVVSTNAFEVESNILQPFDLFCWIFILIITIVFTLISKVATGSQSDWNEVLILWISSMSIGLDQPAPHVSTMFQDVVEPKISGIFRKCKTVVWINWGIWMLTSVLLSQVFKGTVFSYLSQSVPPEVPETLPDLMETDMRIGSIETTFMGTLFQTRRSNPMVYGNGTIYEHLWTRIEAMMADPFQLVMASVFSAKLRITSTTNISLTTSRLPPQFAMLDDERKVESVKLYFEAFTTIWISKMYSIPSLMLPKVWKVRQNFFFPIFRKNFARIYESGLYEAWTQGKKEQQYKGRIVEIWQEMVPFWHNSQGQHYKFLDIKLSDNRISSYINYFFSSERTRKNGMEHFSQVPFSVYLYVFKAVAFGFALSMVALCIERFSKLSP